MQQLYRNIKCYLHQCVLIIAFLLKRIIIVILKKRLHTVNVRTTKLLEVFWLVQSANRFHSGCVLRWLWPSVLQNVEHMYNKICCVFFVCMLKTINVDFFLFCFVLHLTKLCEWLKQRSVRESRKHDQLHDQTFCVIPRAWLADIMAVAQK